MNLLHTQALKVLFIFGVIFSPLAVLFYSPSVSAESVKECGTVKTSIIDCSTLGGNDDGSDTDGSHIFGLIIMAINILTAGIGIVAVGGLVYGALLYTSASDNQGQVQKAMDIIKNVVIGLIAYFALFAFLQYLIPGGVFNVSEGDIL